MPNPITSTLTDIAASAITSKLQSKVGKHLPGSDYRQNNKSNGGLGGAISGLNLNSAIDRIASGLSAISSSSSVGSHNKEQSGHSSPYHTPSTQNNNSGYMSGYGYGGGSGGSGYPPPNQHQPPYGQPQHGGTPYPPSYPPNYPGGGPLPQHSTNAPQQPPQVGFNLGGVHGQYGSGPNGGYPPPSATAYPNPNYGVGAGGAYQPNLSAAPHPQQPQMYGSSQQQTYGQHPQGGGQGGYHYPGASAYPSPPMDHGSSSYNHGSNVSGSYGGYPQQQQPSHAGAYDSRYGPAYNAYNSSEDSYARMNSSHPSIRANPNFNASHSAEMLRKAMKGLGCDKHKVVQALCTINNLQRQEVARTYKTMYGKDLLSDLKSELSGDFENFILALMEPPANYDAYQLHKAMEGLGTKESVLIEIMTTRTNAQIQALKMAYQQKYGKELERDLIGETSGYFKRLLVSLCAGGRDEGWHVDSLKANQDARKLYRAGEQRLGTDEAAFNAILAAQNFAQLRMVFDEYQKTSGHAIEQAIINEFSGDIRDGHLAMVKSIRSRPAYFAELLHLSMKGLGTRDNDLIRLVVTRSEVDLADIRNQYQQLYSTPLENAIASDCSGAYKEGLITIVKGN